VLLNYADAAFAPYQAICSFTGKLFGCDEVRSYCPSDIPADFYRSHRRILDAPLGAGNWLWKPYFIVHTLANMNEGDLLIYADSGMQFVNPIAPFLTAMDTIESDLHILGEHASEAQYTRRDAFVLMEADSERFAFSPQRLASAFLLRNTSWARDFAQRYLDCACDPRILLDGPNHFEQDNYAEFVAHRHDQSVFSLLSKKEGVPCPALGLITEGLAPRRQQVLNHTRGKIAPGIILTHLYKTGVLDQSALTTLSSLPR
jgi:hypothetical protein